MKIQMTLGDQTLNRVEQFTYLGNALTNKGKATRKSKHELQ